MEETPKRQLRRRFQLETLDDVRRCLSQEARRLRKLVVADPVLDPIRINKAKAMTGLLRALADVMRTAELEQRLAVLEGAPSDEPLDSVQ